MNELKVQGLCKTLKKTAVLNDINIVGVCETREARSQA